jgi:hypothetical protein
MLVLHSKGSFCRCRMIAPLGAIVLSIPRLIEGSSRCGSTGRHSTAHRRIGGRFKLAGGCSIHSTTHFAHAYYHGNRQNVTSLMVSGASNLAHAPAAG